jgi:hypothetical protein
MAKNRKSQRAEAANGQTQGQGAVKAAAETVTKAAKAAAHAAEEYVVEPAKRALGVGKAARQKPARKRPARPAKRTPAKVAPLARGTSRAAKTMSGGIARALPESGAQAPPGRKPGPR